MDVTCFPAVEGIDVDDRHYRYPGDFVGALTIVVVGFRLEHRKAIESWVPVIERLVHERPGVRGRAFAVLPSSMRLGWRAMRATMRVAMTPEQREVCTVVFTDIGRFTDALGIREREISVLLVDASGAVRWCVSGAYRADTGESLEATLAASSP